MTGLHLLVTGHSGINVARRGSTGSQRNRKEESLLSVVCLLPSGSLCDCGQTFIKTLFIFPLRYTLDQKEVCFGLG